ncbi:MAG: hypothetical protein AAGC86_09950 [Pseudomonadota bacterium]
MPAGAARPTSTRAAVLGSNGIIVAEFCRAFGRRARSQTPGTPRKAVVITKPNTRGSGETGGTPGFFSEVAAGFALAVRLRWYRRFHVTRVF